MIILLPSGMRGTRQLIENNLVEAIIILPRNLFYTTDISVTLWILNKNKKARVVEENGEVKRFRNREREILFMDLRQMGSPQGRLHYGKPAI